MGKIEKILLILVGFCIILSFVRVIDVLILPGSAKTEIKDVYEDDGYNYRANRPTNAQMPVRETIICERVNTEYISTACEAIILSVLHEALKNIKQYPRCALNRTYVCFC